MKILMDTDIGSDIDDAVCLAYLLAQPESELLGITTVSGEPVKRAMIASAICKVAGQSIPIYPGTANPLLIEQRQREATQAIQLDKWDHDTDFPVGEAVNFLRRTIRENPGEITLLTIGPLTNIALLFALDPEIPSLLNSLVMMAGCFLPDGGQKEWNVVLDPHAAEMVYRTVPVVHRSIGLDVTKQVVMDAKDVRSRFQIPLLKPVLDFAEVWFNYQPEITFHDPLAAVTLFDKEVCRFEQGQVRVALDGELQGASYWREDLTGPHEIAVEVDVNRFFEQYFSVFK